MLFIQLQDKVRYRYKVDASSENIKTASLAAYAETATHPEWKVNR